MKSNNNKKLSTKPFTYKAHVGNDQNTVYVSNLSYLRDREGLKQLFMPFGEIIHVKVIIDKKTNRPTGMAFVEMKNQSQAKKAIAALNGQEIDGRTLKAAPAIPLRKNSRKKSPPEEKPQKGEKLSKDSLVSKIAKSKRRKESGLSQLNQFLSKKTKK